MGLFTYLFHLPFQSRFKTRWLLTWPHSPYLLNQSLSRGSHPSWRGWWGVGLPVKHPASVVWSWSVPFLVIPYGPLTAASNFAHHYSRGADRWQTLVGDGSLTHGQPITRHPQGGGQDLSQQMARPALIRWKLNVLAGNIVFRFPWRSCHSVPYALIFSVPRHSSTLSLRHLTEVPTRTFSCFLITKCQKMKRRNQ